jgi:hypothetical protein
MHKYHVTMGTLVGPVLVVVHADAKADAEVAARHLMDTQGRWLAPAGNRGVHPILRVRKCPAPRPR